MNLSNSLLTGLKGFGMGAANVVPGISGGTIALLTGIYGEIIESLNALLRPDTWKTLFRDGIKAFWRKAHGTFLASLLAGIFLSILLLARLMEHVILYYPIETWAFFFGLIIASSVYMMAGIRNWKAADLLLTLAGIAAGVLICTLSPARTPDTLWFVFLCGVVGVCTMILPGISGSFILVIMGKYEYLMAAVSRLDLPVLAVFLLGCLVGILAFAKFLHWLLSKCERQTLLVLIGFVVGSLVKVWPWNDMQVIAKAQFLRLGQTMEAAGNYADLLGGSGLPLRELVDMQYGEAALCCFCGIALVCLLEMAGKSKKRSASKPSDPPSPVSGPEGMQA